MEARGGLMKRAGALLYFIIGILLVVAASAALILWNKTDVVKYWYYFLAGGYLLYGLGTACILDGIKAYRAPRLPTWRVKVGFVTGIVLFAGLVSGLGWFAWSELYHPYQIYPRQFSISFDPAFKFHTQYGDFNQTMETLYASIWTSGNPTTPDGYAWGESYMDRGFVSMYNATKDTKYLWPLLNRTNTIYNNSDRNHDGLPGYGTGTYTPGTYTEYEVWDGVILLPLAQIACIIKNDVNLKNNASLNQTANKYINLCERDIQKWLVIGNWHLSGDQGYFLTPPQNTTAIFNRCDAVGSMILQTYINTGNATYLDMVQRLARFFKAHLAVRTYTFDGTTKEMYTWGYDWNSDNSDTSHACLDVEFAIECFEHGIVFDATDMRRLSNTFFDFIYKGRPAQTAKEEYDIDVKKTVNETNIFSDEVNGFMSSSHMYLVLREAWFQLYRYYENTTLSSFLVFQSLQDLITSMPTRPPYNTSLSVTYMQCLAAIRVMAYVIKEFPVKWF